MSEDGWRKDIMELLEGKRREVDRLDEEIVKLLNKRAHLAMEIGRIKRELGMDPFDPVRERDVMKNVISCLGDGPFPERALKAVYREIMAGCRLLEREITVAFLGPEASFTHQAARMRFGEGAIYLSRDSVSDVFEEVRKGEADWGVVPIQNSIEGIVKGTLDEFVESDLKICDEIVMRIELCLLSNAPSIAEIERVYTNPMALGQCRKWLQKNLPKAEVIEVFSTSEGARRAVSDPRSGAIAGEAAADIYGLRILKKGIEDYAHNMTRFLVVGREMASRRTGKDKTSIAVAIKDRVGALHDLLKPFKEKGINLTMIESRPMRTASWDYIFFLDMNGHIEDEEVAAALEEVRGMATMFKILGSYPSGE
jgi:chorismate mutase/prephenate dehydratase